MNKYYSAGVQYVDMFHQILHKMPLYNDRSGGKYLYPSAVTTAIISNRNSIIISPFPCDIILCIESFS